MACSRKIPLLPALALGLWLSGAAWIGAPLPALGADAPPGEGLRAKVRDIVESGFGSGSYAGRERAREALLKLGPAAGRHLLPYLRDTRYPVLLWTVVTLGDLGYDPAVPDLLELTRRIGEFDMELRRGLARSLSRIAKASPTAERTLLEELGNLPESSRTLVTRAIGFLNVKELVGKICEGLDDGGNSGSFEGQFDGLKALGKRAVYALLEVAEAPGDDLPADYFPREHLRFSSMPVAEYNIKWLALYALGELRDRAALPRLTKLFEVLARDGDETQGLGRACAFACWCLGNPRPIRRVIEELGKLLQPDDSREPGSLVLTYFNLGYTHNMIKEPDKALAYYRRCVFLEKARVQRERGNTGSTAQYNIACIHALRGEVDKAIEALCRAADLGYEDAKWTRKDGDLDNIKADPRFHLAQSRIWVRKAVREWHGGPGGQLKNRPQARRDLTNALDVLREAVDAGLSPAHWIGGDPAFAFLRNQRDLRADYMVLALRMHLRALGERLRGP
jgi:HEAT repeat protein